MACPDQVPLTDDQCTMVRQLTERWIPWGFIHGRKPAPKVRINNRFQRKRKAQLANKQMSKTAAHLGRMIADDQNDKE